MTNPKKRNAPSSKHATTLPNKGTAPTSTIIQSTAAAVSPKPAIPLTQEERQAKARAHANYVPKQVPTTTSTRKTPPEVSPASVPSSPHHLLHNRASVSATPSTFAASRQYANITSTTSERQILPVVGNIDTATMQPSEEQYLQFVKSLGFDESILKLDDDEDFHLDEDDEEDDDEEDDDDEEMHGEGDDQQNMAAMHSPSKAAKQSAAAMIATPPRAFAPSPMAPLSASSTRSNPAASESYWNDLEEELGSLLEEDLEAAVATLLNKQQNQIPQKPIIFTQRSRAMHQQQQQQQQQQSQNRAGMQQQGLIAGQRPFSTAIPGTSSSMEQIVAAQRNRTVTVSGKPPAARPPNAKPSPATTGNVVAFVPTTPLYTSTGTPRTNQNAAGVGLASPATPLREAKRQAGHHKATFAQVQRLRKMLQLHYQLLVQQSVLAVRSAHAATVKVSGDNPCGKIHGNPTYTYGLETADDLAEILDGAVGMLQDLDQNRRDAIRYSIQLEDSQNNQHQRHHPHHTNSHYRQCEDRQTRPRRSLLSQFQESDSSGCSNNESTQLARPTSLRLTRAAFVRTLQEHSSTGSASFAGKMGVASRRTTFNISGLPQLVQTLQTLDASVDTSTLSTIRKKLKQPSVLDGSPSDACSFLLNRAGASIEESHLPLVRPLSEHFSDVREFLGPNHVVGSALTEQEQQHLIKNRNIFTSAEDNLVLRGINLYGEKQWLLIADRYLPDRTTHNISQRYSKLCLLIYRARGVSIDDNGNLATPPKLESSDDIDEKAMEEAKLTKVSPPAILNVHRWSLEEDLALLKAVPIMGPMWAELRARLIPHRDRGHLRKRYQVLERRVKATLTRAIKSANTEMIPSGRAALHAAMTTKKNAKKAASTATRNPSRAKGKMTSSLPPAAVGSLPDRAYLPNSKHAIVGASKVAPSTLQRGMMAKPVLATANAPFMVAAANAPAKLKASAVQNTHLQNSATASLPPVAQTNDALAYLETSKTGFDRLLDGTEWSQISHMSKLLDNENNTMDLSDGLHKLAHSNLSFLNLSNLPDGPDGPDLSNLPPVDGISLSRSKGTGILANVLGRANSNSNSRSHASKRRKIEPIDTAPPESPPTDRTNNQQSQSRFESPRKQAHDDGEFQVPTTPVAPCTPSKDLFSPASFASPLRPSPHRGSASGFSLTPNATYSPANLNLYSPSGNSTLREGLSGFLDMSNQSRPSIMRLDPHPSSIVRDHEKVGASDDQAGIKTDVPLTPSRNSLLFPPTNSLLGGGDFMIPGGDPSRSNDIEAALAMNTLRSSPLSTFPKRRVELSTVAGETRTAGDSKPKSLFATVVGASATKKKKATGKRKLDFS